MPTSRTAQYTGVCAMDIARFKPAPPPAGLRMCSDEACYDVLLTCDTSCKRGCPLAWTNTICSSRCFDCCVGAFDACLAERCPQATTTPTTTPGPAATTLVVLKGETEKAGTTEGPDEDDFEKDYKLAHQERSLASVDAGRKKI